MSATTYFDNFLVSNAEISRSTYAIAGQVIATRISGDPVSSNNGLFYLFSDHLGSTSVLATSTGTQVPGSRATYYPFGSPRTAPTQTITDRNFTGQKENMELGLIYYNARYYVPGIARFLTPDTIVPNPQSPQQFNRYTYTLNNPTRFTDPSGHRTCTAQEIAAGDETCDQNGSNDERPLSPSNQSPCDDIWCQPVAAPGSRHLTLIELQALIEAVYAETQNGTYPPELIAFITWVYLNRISSGGWDNMLEAVKPDQSAIGVLFEQYEAQPYENAIQTVWDNRENPNWDTVEEIVGAVFNDWFQYGGGSDKDPTNGSTYFVAVDNKLRSDTGDTIILSDEQYASHLEQLSTNFQAYQQQNSSFIWVASGTYPHDGSPLTIFAGTEDCVSSSLCP